MRRALVAAACVLVALGAALPAAGARFAVGLHRGADRDAVAARVAAVTGARVQPLTPFALVVTTPSASGLERLRGVAFVERLDRSRSIAFSVNDPLAKKQWHLSAIRAFDHWPVRPTSLEPVKVAVIDSGIDGSHPEFEHRIADAQSFVDTAPRKDAVGHGTFVAGIIAAALNNGTGIAGVAFPSRLLVAKVVRPDGSISPEAEARAIRWAADQGARVINLSLAALRNPDDPRDDLYSPLEAAAIEYAVGKGALVVAAVGNGDSAPRRPWPYASYPAALPHVLGVGALARDGSVPDFSNRDPHFNDLVAPGTEILSTVPRPAAGGKPVCADPGYSICGPDDFRRGQGTSFAAAQATAAAALLLAQRPGLRAEQARTILERSAADLTERSGCRRCSLGRDETSGWGLLDVGTALGLIATEVPADALEPNDDAGTRASTLRGHRHRVRATLDGWDDRSDVYRVFLGRKQRLLARLQGPVGTTLSVWRPGTRTVHAPAWATPPKPLRRAAVSGPPRRLVYRARARGWHFVHVAAADGTSGSYSLSLTRR